MTSLAPSYADSSEYNSHSSFYDYHEIENCRKNKFKAKQLQKDLLDLEMREKLKFFTGDRDEISIKKRLELEAIERQYAEFNFIKD